MDIRVLCEMENITLDDIKNAYGDINGKDYDGCTTFHHIISKLDLQMLKYCIKIMKADIHAQNRFGHTPFYWLCSNPIGIKSNIIKYCIKVMKCDVNARDMYGNDPFHWILKKTFTEKHKLIKYLCKNTLINAENMDKLSPTEKLAYCYELIIVDPKNNEYVLY